MATLDPAVAATCSGVSPHSFVAETGKPSVSNSARARGALADAATCKAVIPCDETALRSVRRSLMRSFTHSTSSDAHAQRSAVIA